MDSNNKLTGFEELNKFKLPFLAADTSTFAVAWANDSAVELFGGALPADLSAICESAERTRLIGQALSKALAEGYWQGELTLAGSSGGKPASLPCIATIEMVCDGGQEYALFSFCLAKELAAREKMARKISLIAERTRSYALLCDAAGVVEWANLSFLKDKHLLPGEAVGKTLFAALGLPDGGSDPEAARLKAALAGGLSASANLKLAGASASSERWILAELAPNLGSDGKIDGFVCICSDVTEIHCLQSKLKKRALAAEELAKIDFSSEMSLDERFEYVKLWLRDYADIAHADLYRFNQDPSGDGAELAPVLDRPDSALLRTPGQNFSAGFCKCQLCSPSSLSILDIRQTAPDGCRSFKPACFCAKIAPHGHPWGVLLACCPDEGAESSESEWKHAALVLAAQALAKEISEIGQIEGLEDQIKQRNAQLTGSNAKLEEALSELRAAQDEIARQERLGAFARAASGLARDLAEPVASATMAAPCLKAQAALLREALEKGGLTSNTLRAIAESLEESAAALSEAGCKAQKILGNFDSSFTSGADEFDAAAEIRHACAVLFEKMREQGAQAHLRLPASAMCYGSAAAVARISKEICENALLYGLTAPQPEFVLSGREADGHFCVTFSDNGSGIAKERKSRMFEAVFGSEQNQRELGLASCWMLAKQTGGELALLPDSASPLKGACFELRIPLCSPALWKA